MTSPDGGWFLLAFIGLWLAISGFLSLSGGWYELSKRFKSDEAIDGRRFRLCSAAVGSRVFPVGYGSCLFAIVGRRGLALSVLFPFRFLHPRLVIPWSAVERCEEVRGWWFIRHIAVYVRGFHGKRLLFRGTLGREILGAWTQAHRLSRVV